MRMMYMLYAVCCMQCGVYCTPHKNTQRRHTTRYAESTSLSPLPLLLNVLDLPSATQPLHRAFVSTSSLETGRHAAWQHVDGGVLECTLGCTRGGVLYSEILHWSLVLVPFLSDGSRDMSWGLTPTSQAGRLRFGLLIENDGGTATGAHSPIYASSHHLFSSRTCASSSGVKSLTMLNVLRISSGVFPLIIDATFAQVKSSKLLMSM